MLETCAQPYHDHQDNFKADVYSVVAMISEPVQAAGVNFAHISMLLLTAIQQQRTCTVNKPVLTQLLNPEACWLPARNCSWVYMAYLAALQQFLPLKKCLHLI